MSDRQKLLEEQTSLRHALDAGKQYLKVFQAVYNEHQRRLWIVEEKIRNLPPPVPPVPPVDPKSMD